MESAGGSDYGTDVYFETYDDDGYIENESVRLQVKASDTLEPLKVAQAISFSLSKRDLQTWLRQANPVILVCHDAKSGTSCWLYVQRYFEELRGFDLTKIRKSVQIHIPLRQILDVLAMKTFAKFKQDVIKQVDNAKISHAGTRYIPTLGPHARSSGFSPHAFG